MTMKIEVTIPAEAVQSGEAGDYLASAMRALGYARPAAPVNVNVVVTEQDVQKAEAHRASETAAEEPEQAEAPKRERGKPAPGRARRTKEEIAEDEAAERAEAASAPAEEPKPAISTGEERIDPTTAEDAAQDAADEAAEAEATATPELSHDDVRAALKKYLDAYGTPAAMEDGPKVLKMLFGDAAAKVSDVPGDQASLAKAIAGIEEMLAKNPFGRTVQL